MKTYVTKQKEELKEMYGRFSSQAEGARRSEMTNVSELKKAIDAGTLSEKDQQVARAQITALTISGYGHIGIESDDREQSEAEQKGTARACTVGSAWFQFYRKRYTEPARKQVIKGKTVYIYRRKSEL